MLQSEPFPETNKVVSNWIAERATQAYSVSTTSLEESLLDALLNAVYSQPFAEDLSPREKTIQRRLLLAAAFDLMVAAEYYATVGHVGWTYCPYSETEPAIYYPYTNICPRCVLSGAFHYHQANKPPSGNIGAATSKLLLLFFQSLFERFDRKIEILKGSEPVDAIFLDRISSPHVYLFAEVKSAPLVTLPLARLTDKLTVEEGDAAVALQTHEKVNLTNLYQTPTFLFVPVEHQSAPFKWMYKKFPLGSKLNENDFHWAYRGLTNLLQNDTGFFDAYYKYWLNSFKAYETYDKREVIYWLTNACGQPSPRPANWPKRGKGGGYESVSDGKTSVGMDRTDDIKKSIYQVLKLGAEGKPLSDVNFLVAIVSNIHAARHFDEYLDALKDVIWTRDETGKIKYASQLAPDTPFYNLFDGIISLTQTVSRDPWIDTNFDF